MTSIKHHLVKTLTLLISGILLIILLFLDISVDTYITEQFEQSLSDSGELVARVLQEKKHAFTLDAFLKKVRVQQGDNVLIWINDQLITPPNLSKKIEKMATIKPPNSLSANQSKVVQHTITPNDDARFYFYHLGQYHETKIKSSQQQYQIIMAIFRPSDDLENILVLIDIVFIITAILTALYVRYIVNKIVTKGLQPLTILNEQIRSIDINQDKQFFNIHCPPVEIKTIINELNQFLITNRQLLKSEQRLTCDIAHELKTPIAELISVTEIAIKHPENDEVIATYKEDIKSIGEQMNNIVTSLLLLNSSTNQQSNIMLEQMNIQEKITQISQQLYNVNQQYNNRIQVHCTSHEAINIYCDLFCFETIISNLLANALYYSPPQSKVIIKISSIKTKKTHSSTQIEISNTINDVINQEDLNCFFDPLWQKDPSRTSNQHHGLGLAIVKRLCDAIKMDIKVKINADNLIIFTLIF